MRVSSLTSTEKRETLPGKLRFSEGDHDANRIADVNEVDVGLRHGNDQTKKIVLREPDHRHSLRAGTGSGLDQSAEIREALRNRAREGRGNLRIIEQVLIVLPLGLRRGKLAFRRLQVRFGRLDLGRRSQGLALPVVHFLLCDQSGFGLGDAVQSAKLQLQHIVLSLRAAHQILGVHNLFGSALDRGIVLIQLRLQLGNLERREHLIRLHAASIVDVEFLNVTGFLRVDVDLLERDEFGRLR